MGGDFAAVDAVNTSNRSFDLAAARPTSVTAVELTRFAGALPLNGMWATVWRGVGQSGRSGSCGRVESRFATRTEPRR